MRFVMSLNNISYKAHANNIIKLVIIFLYKNKNKLLKSQAITILLNIINFLRKPKH